MSTVTIHVRPFMAGVTYPKLDELANNWPGRAQKEMVYIDREVTKIPLAQQVKYTFKGLASDLGTINAVLLDDAVHHKTLYFSVVDGVVTE